MMIVTTFALFWNISLSDRVSLETLYATKSWGSGLNAYYVGVEIPLRLHANLSIYPHYDYQKLSMAYPWFRDIDSRLDGSITIDNERGALASHTFGTGVTYRPAEGIISFNIPYVKKDLTLKSIDLMGGILVSNSGSRKPVINVGVKVSF